MRNWSRDLCSDDFHRPEMLEIRIRGSAKYGDWARESGPALGRVDSGTTCLSLRHPEPPLLPPMQAARNVLRGRMASAMQTRQIHVSRAVWQKQDTAPKQPEASSSAPTLGLPPADAELGPLSRPLGIRERPTTLVKTKTQRLKELLDSDVRTAQRRHL